LQTIRLAIDEATIRADARVIDPELIGCPLLRHRVPDGRVAAMPDGHLRGAPAHLATGGRSLRRVERGHRDTLDE
jgi:hypothetical protein